MSKNKNKIGMSWKKGQSWKRLDGAEAKPLSEYLDESIMYWIIFRRSKGLRVLQKLFMKKTLVTFQENKPSEGRAESIEFKASRGWLEKKILISSVLTSCLLSFMFNESKRKKNMNLLRL